MGVDCPASDRLPPGGHGEPAVPPINDGQSLGTSIQERANG
jgi:hypothetical protein